MKKMMQWAMAAALIISSLSVLTACSSSSSNDDNIVDDGILTAQKLAGVWYANYADDQTVGDMHWTRVIEDCMFRADGTGYNEYFMTNGNKLVDVAFVRDNGKLHFTISGNTVTITGDQSNMKWTLNYADGKLTTTEGVVYQKASADQQKEVDQWYAEWKGGNSASDGDVVNLSQSIFPFYPSEITIQDGQTVTGTLYGNREVYIAAGATVTLLNVNIPYYTSSNREGFGLATQGDATIILEGENVVVGGAGLYNAYFGFYAGIAVADKATLTIKGSGKLTASCAFSSYLILLQREQEDPYRIPLGPGIQGNVVIESGNIVAAGGQNTPGIDGAFADGNITIKGGTVVAYGGENAPGIGSGCGLDGTYAECGKVTIENTVKNVTAYGGENAIYAIGLGNQYSTCGTITIGGTVYLDNTGFQNGGDSYLRGRPFVYVGTGN